MKKIYEKPEMCLFAIENETMIAASGDDTGLRVLESSADNSEVLAPNRRQRNVAWYE